MKKCLCILNSVDSTYVEDHIHYVSFEFYRFYGQCDSNDNIEQRKEPAFGVLEFDGGCARVNIV